MDLRLEWRSFLAPVMRVQTRESRYLFGSGSGAWVDSVTTQETDAKHTGAAGGHQ